MENKKKYEVPEEFKDVMNRGKKPFTFLTFTRRPKEETDKIFNKNEKTLNK